MRLYLESRAPRQSDLERLKSDNQTTKKDAQRKIEVFEVIQKCCIVQDLHQTALEIISEPNQQYEILYESLNLLIWILYLGNKNSQDSIYILLKEKDRALCMNFFYYLRMFFQQDLDKQTVEIAQLKRLQELER